MKIWKRVFALALCLILFFWHTPTSVILVEAEAVSDEIQVTQKTVSQAAVDSFVALATSDNIVGKTRSFFINGYGMPKESDEGYQLDWCAFFVGWKANTYTITYDANGGDGAPEAQTKTHGTALTLSTMKPTRSGYTFQGWAESKTATAAQYQPGPAGSSPRMPIRRCMLCGAPRPIRSPLTPTGARVPLRRKRRPTGPR